MTAAMVRARNDGAGSCPAASARMAEDLEVPRPLRLLLTAGWNLTESVGLPAAAYVVAAGLGAAPRAWSRGWWPSGSPRSSARWRPDLCPAC